MASTSYFNQISPITVGPQPTTTTTKQRYLDPREYNKPGPITIGTQPNIQYVGPADPVGGEQPVPPPLLPQANTYAPDTTPQLPPPSLNPIGGVPNIGYPDVAGPPPATTPEAQYLAGIGNTGPTTREVTDNELVQNQLEGLLSGNSSFIRNARLRASELANSRGQFGSSLGAGAAERAATEAALPIAQYDAQAYRDAAAQNMTALNNNALAQLQRVAQLETANLSAATQTNIANLDSSTRLTMANIDAMTRIDISKLDAATQTNIAKMNTNTQLKLQDMQSRLELTMQTRNMQHDVGMESIRQDGRVELANLDADLQKLLQSAGFDHDFNMADINQADRLEVESLVNEYNNSRQDKDFMFQRESAHANMAMQVQMNYMNYLSSFAGTEMDSNAAERLQKQADGWLVAQMDMVNGLYPEQDPIIIGFEDI